MPRNAVTDEREDMIFGDDFCVDEINRSSASPSRGWVPNLRTATLFGAGLRCRTPVSGAAACMKRSVGSIARCSMPPTTTSLRWRRRGGAAYVPLTFGAFRRHAGQKSTLRLPSAYQIERRRVRARELDADRTGPR